MKKFTKIIFVLTLVFLFSALAVFASPQKTIFSGNIDISVSPGEDFYQYANGTWLKNNPIPDEYSRWGSFPMLNLETLEKLNNIMKNAATDQTSAPSEIKYKVGVFYKTGMDEAKIEKDGASPLKEELDKIEKIKNLKDLNTVISYMHRYTCFVSPPLFYLYASPDYENSNFMIAEISQGGLGLPERDYYVNKDEASQKTRQKYVEHIADMFKLIGMREDEAKSAAKAVMDIETSLAVASKTNVEMRDPKANSNKISFNQLKKLAPNFDWDIYFNNSRLNKNIKINVGQPKFLSSMSKMLASYPLENWKLYLKWNLARNNAGYLSSDFVNKNFDFYGKYLLGSKKIQPRWKRVVNTTSDYMDEAVGELFVKEYFPPEAKKKALAMVRNIINTFGDRIKALDWMSEKTKIQALKKLGKINTKIGYPDRWEDFSRLQVKEDSYYANIVRANNFWFNKKVEKVGKPVDKAKWSMTPQTVNACYDSAKNDITFPAAILQPPFFDFMADDAVNYGAFGAVIGHEITHGFDDQGRQYDLNGNLRDWWTKQDEQKFIKKADVVIKQYSAVNPIDDLHIKGELTLGENIADLGGVTIAMEALKKTADFNSTGKIEDFTPLQRFFLSWAKVWRMNIRPEMLRLRLKTDVHSPSKYRTNIPLSNLQDFFDAFVVKDADKMYRLEKNRAKIW